MALELIKARADREIENRSDIDSDLYDYGRLAENLMWRGWATDKPIELPAEHRDYLDRAEKRQRALYSYVAQIAQIKDAIERLDTVATTAAAYGLPEDMVRDGIMHKLRALVGLAN